MLLLPSCSIWRHLLWGWYGAGLVPGCAVLLVNRGSARAVPAGPNLWGNMLSVLTAVAHLLGHCPTSPAQYVWAGQLQCNTELSLPLASPVLHHPQMRKTAHTRSSTCHFLTWSVCTSTNERPPAEQLHERGVSVRLQVHFLPPGGSI